MILDIRISQAELDYKIHPAHEGTPGEIIPETIELISVKIRGLEIINNLSAEDIETIICEIDAERSSDLDFRTD